MANYLNTRIKNRIDSAENWTSNNPTLLDGEIGFESDTGRYKIGNGESDWNNLEYKNEENIKRLIQENKNIFVTQTQGLIQKDIAAYMIKNSITEPVIANTQYYARLRNAYRNYYYPVLTDINTYAVYMGGSNVFELGSDVDPSTIEFSTTQYYTQEEVDQLLEDTLSNYVDTDYLSQNYLDIYGTNSVKGNFKVQGTASATGVVATNGLYVGDPATPSSWKSVAMEADIPTKTSQLTNDSSFISKSGGKITGKLNLEDQVIMGETLPSKGDGSKVYNGVDFSMLTTVSGISGLYVNSAKNNLLYCLHYNKDLECTCNYKGDGTNVAPTTADVWYATRYSDTKQDSGYLGGLFEGGLATGATFPIAELSTKPVVFTIKTTSNTRLDVTDTLAFGITGWRYEGDPATSYHYGYLTDYKVEICTDWTNNTWVETFSRTGVQDWITNLIIPTWSSKGGTTNYTDIFGIRLTISGAGAQGLKNPDCFGITELRCYERRPSGKPADGVGAPTKLHPTIYGNLTMASKYSDDSIRPAVADTIFLGTQDKPFRRVYTNELWEKGEKVSNTYMKKFGDDGNISGTFNGSSYSLFNWAGRTLTIGSAGAGTHMQFGGADSFSINGSGPIKITSNNLEITHKNDGQNSGTFAIKQTEDINLNNYFVADKNIITIGDKDKVDDTSIYAKTCISLLTSDNSGISVSNSGVAIDDTTMPLTINTLKTTFNKRPLLPLDSVSPTSETTNYCSPSFAPSDRNGVTLVQNGTTIKFSGTSTGYWTFDSMLQKTIPAGHIIFMVFEHNKGAVHWFGIRLRNSNTNLTYAGSERYVKVTATDAVDRIQFYGSPDFTYDGTEVTKVEVYDLTEIYGDNASVPANFSIETLNSITESNRQVASINDLMSYVKRSEFENAVSNFTAVEIIDLTE